MASILSVGELRGLAENSNVVTVPSGHLFRAPGHIVQIASQQFTTNWSSTSTSWIATNYSLTFTPKYSDSLLRVSLSVNMSIDTYTNGSTNGMQISIYRDGTNIAQNSQGSIIFSYNDNTSGSNYHQNQSAVKYISANNTNVSTFVVWTRISHGSGRAKIEADWGNTTLEIAEIAQ